MSKTISFFILFLSSTLVLNAQQLATFKIFESQFLDSHITIVYENGKSKVIDLESVSFLSLSSDEDVLTSKIKNQKIITEELNKMKNKGYSISTMSMSGESHQTTLIIFIRE